jgi:hypothetical protein
MVISLPGRTHANPEELMPLGGHEPLMVDELAGPVDEGAGSGDEIGVLGCTVGAVGLVNNNGFKMKKATTKIETTANNLIKELFIIIYIDKKEYFIKR